ncbi:MAG: hypothetical protein ABIZ80_13735 [Bryobacteraceae bacterium]
MDAGRIDAVVFPTWVQLPSINGDRNTQLVAEPKPPPNEGPTTSGGSRSGIGSALQWPAISVPSGFLGEGLPQGLQILGRAWDDAKIAGYAYAYEQATHHRRPPSTVPPLASSLSNRFIGTWQLVGSRGPVSGQLIYAANGRMSLNIVGFGSYFGRWELAAAEGVVIHHVQAGQTERYAYSFDADRRLVLSVPAREGSRVFVWERIP